MTGFFTFLGFLRIRTHTSLGTSTQFSRGFNTGTSLVSYSQYGWDLREQVSSGRSWTTVFLLIATLLVGNDWARARTTNFEWFLVALSVWRVFLNFMFVIGCLAS